MGSTGDCHNLPAKRPQFFKIILENTMQQKRLAIPRKFVKEYGNDLPEFVTLEVPDGAQWQIKLTKTQDGQVWMEQGWLNFARHYSLSHGNFLVFNPQGLSKFLVVIFDVTALEIKYAPLITRENELVKNPLKRERANSCAIECGSVRLKNAKKDADLHVSSQDFEGGCNTTSTQIYQSEDRRNNRRFTSAEKAKLLEICRGFQSSKPWFKVLIQLSALYRKNREIRLDVPTKFFQKYFSQWNGNVILQNKKWRTWSVKYRFEAIKGQSGLRTKLGKGWKVFSMDNKLEVGDVCVFEMITVGDMIFNVVIFRGRKTKFAGLENEKSSGGDITDRRSFLNFHDEPNKSTKVKNEANQFTRKYPSFAVEMENAYIQGRCLNVPSSFARNYIKTRASTIKLKVEDKSWRVNLFKYQNGVCKISAGWTAFAKENFLKPKDICKFEFIQRNHSFFFRVSISRNTSNSD